MNPQPVFEFEQPIEDARAVEAARLAAEHAAGMAEWQARVNQMLAERAARKQAKLAEQTAALIRREERRKAIAEREAQRRRDIDWRQFKRNTARAAKTPDEIAQCGINWYCRSPHERATGTYWKTCKTCGQPLVYTTDRNAPARECPGRPT